jgi:hypothetical protein
VRALQRRELIADIQFEGDVQGGSNRDGRTLVLSRSKTPFPYTFDSRLVQTVSEAALNPNVAGYAIVSNRDQQLD